MSDSDDLIRQLYMSGQAAREESWSAFEENLGRVRQFLMAQESFVAAFGHLVQRSRPLRPEDVRQALDEMSQDPAAQSFLDEVSGGGNATAPDAGHDVGHDMGQAVPPPMPNGRMTGHAVPRHPSDEAALAAWEEATGKIHPSRGRG